MAQPIASKHDLEVEKAKLLKLKDDAGALAKTDAKAGAEMMNKYRIDKAAFNLRCKSRKAYLDEKEAAKTAKRGRTSGSNGAAEAPAVPQKSVTLKLNNSLGECMNNRSLAN